MTKSRDYIALLTEVIQVVAGTLGFQTILSLLPRSEELTVDSVLGDPVDRSQNMAGIINDVNAYVVSSDPSESIELRDFVIEHIPRFLLGYQSVRFPQIINSRSTDLPTKADLSKFPELINDTGLFVPVSSCLRLIAVSLVDERAKQKLIDTGNVKAIVSHMVDDPLNPFQREAAIFVINIFTRDYPPAQSAASSIMNYPRPS